MRVEITAADLAPAALRRWASEQPDQVLLDHVDGRTATYRELVEWCERFAAGLRARGLEEGTPVGILVADTFECARAWLAVTAAGMVAVPMNAALIGRTLEHVLRTSEVRAVVVESALLDRFESTGDGAVLEWLIVVGAIDDPIPGVLTIEMEALVATGDAVEPFAPELYDTAMFLFTSGTTGPAKAVVIPWAAAHSHWSQVPADTLGPGEALYAPVAMFHNSGIGALQYVVWKGGRLVLREKFSATAYWDDVRRKHAVASGIVGPMTAVLWAQPPRPDDADNPLRSLVLGPMIESMEAFEERFGTRVCTSYGMTEVPSMIATGWDHGPWPTCGTVCEGWPWPEVELVDEHDDPVPQGQVGQMVVRTRAPWALNAGYHGDPAATAEAWRNGWFHTGDAFTRDDEGRYYFVDRMKDTIRRRGENISSFEVESAVGAHEAVAECAAYAVPDGFGGDDVMVAVVPTDPARPPEPGELFAFLAASMPAYMVPRYVDVVDELPRNATTLRVQKFVLRERGITEATWDRNDLTDR
jgi:crotonobetaine/carnitine-CoA ligase